MKLFDQKEFYECATRFSVASNPADVARSWLQLKGGFSELSGVVHLDNYNRTVLPSCIRKYTKEPLDYLVPYFMSESLYFVDNKMLKSIVQNEMNYFPIDYTVMFDTNMASYINKLVRGESIGEVQERLLPLVDELLRDDLNFDFIFYLVENIKIILPTAKFDADTKLGFWMSLDKNFRKNLCSLHLFASIDCKEYKKTLNPKVTISYRQSVKTSIDSAYSFYANKKELTEAFLLQQRTLLLNLIGMIRIQEESNKNARNKMSTYLSFMHHTVGSYMDREAIIAHKYFLSRDNLPILNKIQKRCDTRGLLKKLDNIAWDMVAPRMMENLISSGLESEGEYFVPMFLTFDKNLKKMLQLHPIKGVIYNRNNGDIISFPNINSGEYFEEKKLAKDIHWICSDELKLERRARKRHTRLTLHRVITSEYRQLRKTLKL